MSSALRVGARQAMAGLLLSALIGLDGLWITTAGADSACKRSAQGPHGRLPQDATWQPLPAGPVDGRVAASVVWTGREVVVWGGEAGSELARKADGAAFDPSRGTWRELAASPVNPRSEHAAVWTSPAIEFARQTEGTGGERAVWAGDSLVAWTGNVDARGVRALRFDVTRGQWDELPTPSVLASNAPDLLFTGTSVIAWRPGGAFVLG